MHTGEGDDWARACLIRLEERLVHGVTTPGWHDLRERLLATLPSLYDILDALYGDRPDFESHLATLIGIITDAWSERPSELRALDERRAVDPLWFQSSGMMGGVCYVDLFAGTVQGLRERIPYLQELGLTYLHLMPPFLSPQGNNDGGYAISSYRRLDPRLGSMDDLRALAADLRAAGISLVLDFVFNHTSDEHPWARLAQEGDASHRDYYWVFDHRDGVERYQPWLRDIFPDQRPGSFTFRPDMQAWIWTTFNSFQWDLNYRNPAVFNAMAEEMLYLANVGAEVLRLDALAFIWKEPGTPCESLPQAHLLVQAFNAVARIAAPALEFKSEAIVHPVEVDRYIHPDQCRLSYNPLLMALLWESLATRRVTLLQRSLAGHLRIDPRCAWVNYVRSHDDIGWTFDDADAAALGIDAQDHRRFLNAFYTGRFPGSFARGLPFGENPVTGDVRIAGTCASLAGLDAALESGEAGLIDHAVRRILLLYSVVLSIGGIPLLYLGDEVASQNDYSFSLDPARSSDSRWLHRPTANPANVKRRNDLSTVEGRVFSGLCRMVQIRQSTPFLVGGDTTLVDTENDHVLGYLRHGAWGWMLVLVNFSDRPVVVPASAMRRTGYRGGHDVLTGQERSYNEGIPLDAYQSLWLRPAS